MKNININTNDHSFKLIKKYFISFSGTQKFLGINFFLFKICANSFVIF